MRRSANLKKLSIPALTVLLALGCDSPTETSAISIALSEQAVIIGQGASKTVTVNVGRTNFDGAVTLSVDGAPSGVSASFSPSSLPSGGASSTLQISATGAAAPGTTTLTVRASGEGVAEQRAAINLTVTVTGTYAMSMLSHTVTVAQGGAASATLLVTRTNSFTGTVSFAVSGAPPGVTATFDQEATSGRSVAVRLAATSSATPGTYTLTVTGTSAGLSGQTITFSVVVIPPPSTASLTFRFCPDLTPIWFAYQNEGYAWQQVTPEGTSFTFAATEKVGLAWVFQFGSVVYVLVLHAARSEYVDPSAYAFCLGSKSLTGSVTDLPLGQLAIAGMGASHAFATPSSTTFSLRNLATRPLDLVAARGFPSDADTTGWGPAVFTPDRLIIRRSLDLPVGATIPPLDFASSEAFAPMTTSLTITGLQQGDDVQLANRLWSATSTIARVYWGRAAVGVPAPLYSVPASHLVSGDLHELWVDARASISLLRSYVTYFGAPADRTDAMGPYIGTPTVTSLSSAPYARMRGQLAAQSEYGGAAGFIIGGLSGASRNVQVFVTAAYLGGTPSTWDVVIPDLTGTPGFQTSWMPMPDQAPYYEVFALSTVQTQGRVYLDLPLFRVAPRAGDVHRYSARAGFVGAAQQARTHAALASPLLQHFRR